MAEVYYSKMVTKKFDAWSVKLTIQPAVCDQYGYVDVDQQRMLPREEENEGEDEGEGEGS